MIWTVWDIIEIRDWGTFPGSWVWYTLRKGTEGVARKQADVDTGSRGRKYNEGRWTCPSTALEHVALREISLLIFNCAGKIKKFQEF